jgi:integrase
MLNDAVESYLTIRRAAGFQLHDDARYLSDFARFATARGETHVVAETAIAWAAHAPSEPQRATRLKAVVRFAHFSHAADRRHELPPPDIFAAHRRRPTPYLFRAEEVQALMRHATQLEPVGSLRPHTYRTLIGLLAATGLRISEALGLRFPDVTADGLVIHETKFHKHRLVPVHPTTRAALEQYLAMRTQFAAADDHLFVSLRGRRLHRTAVSHTFVALLTAAGLASPLGRARPRLIDFRHTFASKALLTSPDSRERIGRHTLALMTYLGHAHVSSTFWYLERSPQLLDDIAQTCERFIEEATP